nr:enoyl-CoA hydratase-related protein [Mycobacterium tuberculosis]
MREQPPAEGVVDRVALQRHRNVALITLSHPQAQNALNLASWRRLKRLLDDLAGESGLRAVVLRGAGDKAFVSFGWRITPALTSHCVNNNGPSCRGRFS